MKFRGLTSNFVKTRPLSGLSGARPARPKITGTAHDWMIVDELNEKPQRNPALKGVKGGNCNITACQKPGAHFWNRVMDAHYCHYCATDMHRFAQRVKEETLFPNYDAELAELRAGRRAEMIDLIESLS